MCKSTYIQPVDKQLLTILSGNIETLTNFPVETALNAIIFHSDY